MAEQQIRSANHRPTLTITTNSQQHFVHSVAYGSGQLTVLEAPKALDFVHTDAPLATDSLADLYAAALGHSVAGSDNWSGLRINDPFNAPLLAVAFVIPTLKTNLQLAAAPARYQLSGAGVQAALATLDARVQTEYIDLAAVAAETKTDAKQTDAKFVALKPESNAAERKFVAVTAAIARFADNVELSPSAAPLFVSAVVPTEGLAASSDLAQTEARKLLQQAVQQATAALQKKFGDAVLVTLVEHDAAEPQQLQRQKRQAAAGSEVSSGTGVVWLLGVVRE